MASHIVTMLSLCKSSGTISLNCEPFLSRKAFCVDQVNRTSNAKNTIHVDDLVSGILSLSEDTELRVLIGP